MSICGDHMGISHDDLVCPRCAGELVEKEIASLKLQVEALRRLESVARYEHEGSCKVTGCGICNELERIRKGSVA